MFFAGACAVPVFGSVLACADSGASSSITVNYDVLARSTSRILHERTGYNVCLYMVLEVQQYLAAGDECRVEQGNYKAEAFGRSDKYLRGTERKYK